MVKDDMGWVGIMGMLMFTALPAVAVLSVTRAQYLMGTLCEITVFGADHAELTTAVSQAFAEISGLEDILSGYREHSELSQLNRSAYNQPIACSIELFTVLTQAVRYSQLTQGAFDITIAPLVRVWGVTRTGRFPTSLELRTALGAVGSQSLVLDPGTRQAFFAKPGMAIDVGAIGKGYAVDAAVATLKRQGVTAALINFGGQLHALGHPPGRPGWEVVVADPRDERKPAVKLVVQDRAISTSSQTQRFLEIGGRHIGHIVDPRDGQPVSWAGSVTVVAPNGTEADALSTGFFVLGPEEGIRLANRLPEVGAVFLAPNERTNRLAVLLSQECEPLMVEPKPRFQGRGEYASTPPLGWP